MAEVADILKVNYAGKKVESLAQLMREDSFSFPKVGELFDVVEGVKGKQQVGWIGGVEKVTKKDKGCGNNTDNGKKPASGSKTWDPQGMKIQDSMCYSDLVAAWTEWGLKNGIQKVDLTSDDYFLYIAEVYGPAAEQDAFRMSLFGDTNATVVGSGSGNENLTDYPEQDVEDFNVFDGYFVQIDALMTATPERRITIPENAGADLAAQKNLAADRCFNVCEALIDIGDSRLLEKDDVYFLMTYSMYQNLRRYYRDTIKDESSFKRTENGYQLAEHDGIKIVTHREIDRVLRTDFYNGTIVDRPNRVYLLSKANNKFGVDSINSLTDLELEYDGGNRERNYIKGAYLADFIHLIDDYGNAAY